MTGRAVALFIIFLSAVLCVDATHGAAPTLENLKSLKSVDPPNLIARQMIDQYVKFWVGKMTAAKKINEVIEARAALIKGYEIHASKSESWQVEYADISSSVVPSVLSNSDRVKQLQASMTIVAMSQYTIQPALEKMARHRNAAVRYWAVRGYQSIARRILRFGNRSRKMLKTLERLGMRDNGPILSAVLRTLSFSVGEENAARLQAIRDKIWLARRRDLRSGRADVVEAFRKAINYLESVGKSDRKQILQLLIDTLESASLAFVKPHNQKDQSGKCLCNLLYDLEVKLAEITSTTTGNRSIRDILAASDKEKPIVEKAAEIRLMAVDGHWKPLLKKLGVKPRPIRKSTKPVATTATAPVVK